MATNTMEKQEFIEMVRTATHEVFSTMLAMELTDNEAYVDEATPGPNEGVLGLVGLAGSWVGSGSFSCSPEAAQKIAGQMLMQECNAVDDEVLDVIGEVTNMILGNVKTALEEKLGPMGLSIPTVIYGRNFTTRSRARTEWTVVPFLCMGEKVEVHLCLVPSTDAGAMTRHGAVLSIIE